MKRINYLLVGIVWLLAGVIVAQCSSGEDEKQAQEDLATEEEVKVRSYEEIRSQPQLDRGLGFEVKVDHPDWLYNATIYEVNIRQYTQEGTFNAFREHLPRLKELGVKILWLMPIQPIGEKNRKGKLGSYYSVKDYYKVNPEFGTMEDFKRLVDEIHKHGMHVIMGWIANHTAWDNALVTDKPSWYVKGPEGKMGPPRGTDWSDVVALDVRNAKVQQYMIDGMKYWVRETNIDGYRADVAGWAPTVFWARARKALDKIKPVLMLAEAEKPILHEEAFDISYAWQFSRVINQMAEGEKDIKDLKKYFQDYSKDFPKNGIRMYFTSNHDQNTWEGTVYERFGKAADTYFALASTIPGIPLIYGGQEAGLNKQLEFFARDPIDWGAGKDKHSFYGRLVELKRENSALWNGKWGGSMKIISTPDDVPVFAFVRSNNDDKVVSVLNFGGEEVKVQLGGTAHVGAFKQVFTDEEKRFTGNDVLVLEPYAHEIFARTTGRKMEAGATEEML